MANGSECTQLGLFPPEVDLSLISYPLKLVLYNGTGVVLNMARNQVIGFNDCIGHLTYVGKTRYLGKTVELLGLS